MSYKEQLILEEVRALASKVDVDAKTLSATTDVVESGYYEATTLSTVDTDLATANIKAGKTIFGIAGKTEVVDTTEAGNPITAVKLPTDDVGFVNGNKITGSGTKTLSAANDVVQAGYYAATTLATVDADLDTANIKAGVTIFGIAGKTEVVDTADADAVAAEIADGKFAYVGGIKVEGTAPAGADVVGDAGDLEILIPAGLYLGTEHTTASDADLITGNIKAGINIFGVDGKTEVVDTSDADAVAGEILDGKFAYVGGIKVEGSIPTVAVIASSSDYPAGYHEGNVGGLAAIDVDLTAANIVTGKTILGVSGNFTADAATKATGTLTSNETNVAADDTVLIDAKTYTFKGTLTPAEGEVLIGGSASATLDNLKAAINHTGTPDTDYSCAAAHTTVEATAKTDTVLTLLALTAGVAGNAIDLATTNGGAGTLTRSAEHLAGGTEPAAATNLTPGYFAWVGGVKLVGAAA